MNDKAKAKSKQKSQRRVDAGMTALFGGSSNEDLARAHFKRWRWTMAKPEPDIGTDFVVEIPASPASEGLSFALQVRSSTVRKMKETIKRGAALRLKNGVLPAFLVFLHQKSSTGYWVDLEPLFDTDPQFIAGGNLAVPLSDEDSFTLFADAPPKTMMDAICRGKGRGAMKAAGSLKGLADAVSDHYSRIDPELKTEVTFNGQRDVVTIVARDHPVNMSMKVSHPTDDGKAAFRAAFEWGRAAVVQADEFLFSGSPLFEHLTRENKITRAEFHPIPAWEGRGLLVTTTDGQRPNHEIVDVQITNGTKGGECTAKLCEGILQIRIRIDRDLNGSVDANTVDSVMSLWRVDELAKIERALRVISDVLNGSAAELYLTDFNGTHEPMRFRCDPAPADALEATTLPLRAAVALAKLARAKNWCIQGRPLVNVQSGDMESWLAAEKFHREGRLSVPALPFIQRLDKHPELGESRPVLGNFLISHKLKVQVSGELVATLPAWVRFCRYEADVEPADDGTSWVMRCTPSDGATCEYLLEADELPDF